MSTEPGWTTNRYGLSKSVESTVRANPNELVEIFERANGEPGTEPFQFARGDATRHAIKLMEGADKSLWTVERVRNERNWYALHRGVIELLEDKLSVVPECKPCNHTGMVNLGDGQFACGYAPCDETWDRATQERINAERGGGE